MLQAITPNPSTSNRYYLYTEIADDDIVGPFDLQATVKSGQTAMPEWFRTGQAFTDILRTERSHAVFKLWQTADPHKPALSLQVMGLGKIGSEEVREVRDKIAYALDLRRDLNTLYRRFSDEILAESFATFPGLRLMRAWDHFEALVSCLLTQWSSVRGWNTVARRLRKSLGTPLTFPDGSTWHTPLTPENIASASPEVLQKCGTGYRASYLRQAARMILNEELDLAAVEKMPYPEAKRLLMEIPGVGTKVADCLLLYGYGKLEAAPVDVWMHRILQRLYLKGTKLSQSDAEHYLRDRFGRWAGYAQLYLYHHARSKQF